MTFPTFSPLRRLAVLAATSGFLVVLAGPLQAQKDSAIPAKADAKTVIHVLNRIGFGPRPGDVERVQEMGLASYIDQQLHPERIADEALGARLSEFTTLTMSTRELSEKYYQPAMELKKDQQLKQQRAEAKAKQDPTMTDPNNPNSPAPKRDEVPLEVRMIQQQQASVMNELMQAKVIRAAMSEKQLNEVLVDFWFNHFNVYVQKGQVREYLPEYERDVIRPHVFGSFRELLGAVAHSPAMLFYLDNFQSSTPNPQPMLNPQMEARLRDPRLGQQQRQQMLARMQQMQNQQKNMPRGLNENYGRELMELHTLGVDGGYTQKDVVEVARALTGWTIDQPRAAGSFVYRPQMHDRGEKTILGYHFPAGGGQDEGERVLDILAAHPSTAHHIAFQLAQRFVADEPPTSLVDRAAKKFTDTKGDLREVTRLIITSPEFFSAQSYRAKVKTPFEFVASAVRASGATMQNAQPLVAELRTLGMPLYGCQPPTGYSMTADAWVNTGALLNRMNFAVQLMDGGRGMAQDGRGRPGGPPPQGPPPQRLAAGRGQGPGGRGAGPLQVNVKSLAPDTSDASRDQLINGMLAGDVSDATRQTLARAQTPQQLIALALGSPEFQRR